MAESTSGSSSGTETSEDEVMFSCRICKGQFTADERNAHRRVHQRERKKKKKEEKGEQSGSQSPNLSGSTIFKVVNEQEQDGDEQEVEVTATPATLEGRSSSRKKPVSKKNNPKDEEKAARRKTASVKKYNIAVKKRRFNTG